MKKSYIFWLSFGFLLELLTFLIFGFDALTVIWGLGSCIVILYTLLYAISNEDGDGFPWIFWFPVTWIFIAFAGICYYIYKIFEYPVKWINKQFKKFNNYLDR
jgi:hypothetical protein